MADGIKPAEARVRFRRPLNEGNPAQPLKDWNYNHRGTEAEQRAIEQLAIVEATIADSGWPDEAPEGSERVVFASPEGEFEYEYELADLARVGDQMRARGAHHPSDDHALEGTTPNEGEGTTPQKSSQGWSWGTDSRVAKPTGTLWPVTHFALRKIGELNGGGCSASTIGRRLLLTAAHCVVAEDLSYNVHTYAARRTGAATPFGSVATLGYWYSSQWTNNDCHIERTAPCDPHDWAVLLLEDDVWGWLHPGYMGIHVPEENEINSTNVVYNDGYPAWWAGGAPADMANFPNHPYGQLGAGNAVGFYNYFSGYAANWYISNDLSGGHSGSPVWASYPGSGAYALGVVIAERCFGAACATAPGTFKTHPNLIRGMTPYLEDYILDKRVQYP